MCLPVAIWINLLQNPNSFECSYLCGLIIKAIYHVPIKERMVSEIQAEDCRRPLDFGLGCPRLLLFLSVRESRNQEDLRLKHLPVLDSLNIHFRHENQR